MIERCHGPRWIAIGDAAVSYDPLASRGLVAALTSGLETASLVGAPEPQLAAWQAQLEASFQTYRAERARLIVRPAVAHYPYALHRQQHREGLPDFFVKASAANFFHDNRIGGAKRIQLVTSNPT